MARKIVVQVSCDRCGGDVLSQKPVELTYGGVAYRTDLCPTHASELAVALEPYLQTAERIAARRGPATATRPLDERPRRPARRDPLQVGAIRTWARANGYDVSDRGRIPREVEDAYNTRAFKR